MKIYMYKFITISLSLCLGISLVQAQIGINTDNVQAGLVLHIDPKRNNATSGIPTTTQLADDVAIDNNGNMGIGTISPTTKLHIVTDGTTAVPNPQLRINDGYAAINRVLTSNALGMARWSDYVPGSVAGTFTATGVTISGTQTQFVNVGGKIRLDPGQWLIIYTIRATGNKGATAIPSDYRLWVQSVIGDSNTLDGTLTYGTMTPDSFTGNYFSNNVFIGFTASINGWCGVNNASGATKDYYLLVGNIMNPAGIGDISLPGVGANDGYCSLYAFRVNY